MNSSLLLNHTETYTMPRPATFLHDRIDIIRAIQEKKNLSARAKEFLLKFYAIKLTGAELRKEVMYQNNGTIIHQGVVYNIVWFGVNPVQAFSHTELCLSFRQTRHSLDTVNYVLVYPAAIKKASTRKVAK